MKNYSKLIFVIAFVLLAGLVFWQVRHLESSQTLKKEIELQNMQSVLMESAIELRRIENNRTRTDSVLKKSLTDSILQENFSQFNRAYSWGYFDGNGKSIDSLNYDINLEQFNSASFRVCVSCLIMIDVVKKDGESTVDKSYILDQSPSQMRDIIGLDNSNIRYLHIFLASVEFNFKPYILPVLFLIGLAVLFVWIMYLNIKQYRLISQKNEFVNHLSHQFQTPLSSIKLSANMLNKENLNTRDDLIQIIQIESSRLENHIKTVLHWVKSDADRLQIDKTNISLTNTIEQSLKQMKPVFTANKTKINFIPPEEDIHFFADINHVQLMLFNIWENAIKHNDTLVTLTIRCEKIDNHIRISNSDDGQGMQSTVGIKFKGLGLAYIDCIMRLHGGTMNVIKSNYSGLQINLNFPFYD